MSGNLLFIGDAQWYHMSISLKLNHQNYFDIDINLLQFEIHIFYFYKF